MIALRWIVCLAVAAGALVIAPPASADPRPRPPQICLNEINAANRMRADVSELADKGILKLDGRTITVVGPDAQWRQVDDRDQTFVTRFHSLAWILLAVQGGYPVVDLLLEREKSLPDPGSTAPATSLKYTGWTEGAVRLRMGTVSCLYLWTKDERLIPVMERLVLASADPYRYRGLPLKKVHNHGTLTNIQLAEVARVFERDDWWDLAVRRFSADVVRVFSSCGISSEQSSPYQYLNYLLWERSLRILEEVGNHRADFVRTMLDKAALASLQLTRPDGVLDAVGDGNERRLATLQLDLSPTAEDTRLWCPRRGWSANRSSWDDTATHYVLRFGQRVALHGHEDHGSATWFTQGVSVFSDRGLYDKTRGLRYEWARSPAAHNTFEPIGLDVSGPMLARDLSSGPMDRYVLRWKGEHASLVRDLRLPLDSRSIPAALPAMSDDTAGADDSVTLAPMTYMQVTDVGTSRREQQWAQNWQLSPEWTRLPRSSAWAPAAYHEKSGLYLYGTCWSGLYMIPSAKPVEAFPAWRTSVPATTFVCGGAGREVKLDTLWVVTPVKGTLAWDRAAGTFTVTPDASPVESPTARS